jgi:hypothetical protein
VRLWLLHLLFPLICMPNEVVAADLEAEEVVDLAVHPAVAVLVVRRVVAEVVGGVANRLAAAVAVVQALAAVVGVDGLEEVLTNQPQVAQFQNRLAAAGLVRLVPLISLL